MQFRLISMWLLMSLVSGCSEQGYPGAEGAKTAARVYRDSSPPVAAVTVSERGNFEQPGNPISGAANPAKIKTVDRKIIYNAEVYLSVENFDKTAAALSRLIKQEGGYLAEENVTGTPGSHRTGMWKARIPIDKFDAFVEAVIRLGELERKQTNSQDVTEEFFDLEARIKNKKVEEGRLVKHLEESTGKLKEILDVEREISRVREEIERQQGRLQLLANLTSLTTVTIHFNERLDFRPVAAPTFGTRISRTFQASSRQLLRFGENLILALVSIVPWLPLWAAFFALVWLVLRVYWRRPRRESQQPGM